MSRFTKLQDQYYEFLFRFFRYDKQLKILPIDFNKPWWSIVAQQKYVFLLTIFSEVIQAVFSSLSPIILGYAIFNKNPMVLVAFGLTYIILEIFNRTILRYQNTLILQSSGSLNFAAHNFFLTVDPIWHTTKSSGQILSKIDRATQSMQSLIMSFAGWILPPVVGFATIVIVLSRYDFRLGLIGIISFFSITTFNGFARFFTSSAFKKRTITSGDEVKSVVVENLQQNQLIRASFATPEQIERTKGVIFDDMVVDGTSWMGGGLVISITRLMYITGSLSLAAMALHLVQIGQLDAQLAVTLLISYVNGSGQILRIGEMVRQMTENYNYIVDLFEFIRKFGTQSYPVLQNEV